MTQRHGSARHAQALGTSTGWRRAPLSLSQCLEGAALVTMYTGCGRTHVSRPSGGPPPPLTRAAAWRGGGGAAYMAVLLHSSNWLSTETSWLESAESGVAEGGPRSRYSCGEAHKQSATGHRAPSSRNRHMKLSACNSCS